MLHSSKFSRSAPICSFATRFLEQEGGEIRLLTAKEKGKAAWFVLQLNAALYPQYKASLKSGVMNIRDYGTIIASGWGELPASVREKYSNSDKE